MAGDLKMHRRLNEQDLDLLKALNLEMSKIIGQTCRLVKWSKPLLLWIKLNCDGSCRHNPGSSEGRGILHDMDVGLCKIKLSLALPA